MTALVFGALGAWAVFATLRHACSPRQTYTGRHHLAGAA